MNGTLKALLPLGLFAGLAIFLAIGLTRDPSKLPSELIDRPFPSFEMSTLSGDPITRADIVGEAALVNVFGSWCVACLSEHPVFMALSGDPDLTLIGINWRDPKDKADAWLTRYGNPYDRIIYDRESALAIDLGVTGAPETFVIDRDGDIRYKHIGPVTESDWQKTLRPLLRSLNAETP